MFDDKNIDIFGSREEIRNQLVEYAKEYMELENIDLYKTSFVSYIINILSILSANQMYYTSSIYKEFFFIEAQLEESVYNLAKWIGYDISPATPANVDVLFMIPLGFPDPDVTLSLPNDFKVYANDIPFRINTQYTLNAKIRGSDSVRSEIDDMINNGITTRILNNNVITVQDPNGFYYPVQLYLPTDGADAQARFLLPFVQSQESLSSFQIPLDLEYYQFYNKKLSNITGQISSIKVYVFPSNISLPSGTSIQDIDTVVEFYDTFTTSQLADHEWTESEAGIYTLSQSDKKYVWTPYSNEIEITFGNGVLGMQPPRDSFVFVILDTTIGADGNIIPGSITSGDRIFYQSEGGQVQKVTYGVTNPNSATNGSDLPSLSEIKSNAITNLRSRHRLVSDSDYSDFETIVPNLPLQGTKPILKRSDLKINEFMLFSELIYNNVNSGDPEIVPTRNIVFPTDATSVPTFYIPRGTSPSGEFSPFETLFGMEIDLTSSSAKYDYVVRSADVTSSLEIANHEYNSKAYIQIPLINFSADVDPSDPSIVTVSVLANCNHIPTPDITQFRCKITSNWDGDINLMTTDLDPDDPQIIRSFTYDYINFTDFPTGEVSFQFDIEGYIPYDLVTAADKAALGWGATEEITKPSAWLPILIYSAQVIVRKDLSEFMYSSVSWNTMDEYFIHNVPVILSEYLVQPEFDAQNFETVVLQKLISNISVNRYRMLTDFVNVKFPDTTGLLTNMLYNPISKTIISRSQTSIPIAPLVNDTYIINGTEGTDPLGNDWSDYKNYLAKWNGTKWLLTEPEFDEFIIIDNPYETDPDQGKKLIYSGKSWMEPIFNIPFTISLKIRKDPNVATTSGAIVSNIRTALIDGLAGKLGLNVDIDKSEIISIVRGVSGVQYAEILQPEIDIRFKFDIDDLSQSELLDYTPQLVAFVEETIQITVVT